MPICLIAPTHDIRTPADVQYNYYSQTATHATLAGQGAVCWSSSAAAGQGRELLWLFAILCESVYDNKGIPCKYSGCEERYAVWTWAWAWVCLEYHIVISGIAAGEYRTDIEYYYYYVLLCTPMQK